MNIRPLDVNLVAIDSDFDIGVACSISGNCFGDSSYVDDILPDQLVIPEKDFRLNSNKLI